MTNPNKLVSDELFEIALKERGLELHMLTKKQPQKRLSKKQRLKAMTINSKIY